MFRWLKDRSKKSRKPSPSGSQRSKEDDYGFKQLQQKQQQQQQQQQQQGDIYKRDLPPTPADLMTSSHDDDRSLHIYEEIPDLPFRCTPEGELRITLAREQARKHTPPPNPPPGSAYGIRNISPYMVVPLEKVRETPSEFRSGFPQRGETSFPKAAGAGGGPGAGRDSASPGSCCGSSVFGSPFAAAGGCGTAGGDLGGDISDRLLNAINLTRLLAAVRLSSSSADTCTTSPICIGVDKDGRNISVSVSVTPTTPTPNSHHHNDDADNKGVEEPSRGNTTTTTTTTRNPPTSLHSDTVGNTTTTTTTTRNPPTTLHNDTVPEVVPPAPAPVSQSGLTSATETGSAPEADRGPPGQDGQTSGFRLVPSPTEQSAIWEVLQLKPGESTELDPPTIDALILKLCSHTLQTDSGSLLGGGEVGGQLHSRQLQELEDMLRELVRTGEGESDPHHPSHPSSSSSSTLPHPSTTTTTTATASSSASSLPHPSPAVRRAENSDTGFEYDVSTSSESDQTSYDYFLSKVARTRSLECEVKKLIHSSGSGEEDEDEEEDREEEEEEGEGESFSTVSTISPATSHPPPSPEADVTGESDDGTMADLSESENSSGYYETTTTAATTTTATSTTSTADTTQSTTRSPRGSEQACGQSRPSPRLSDDLDVPCYELDCRDGSGGLVVGTTDSAQLYSHICDASGVTRSSKGKSGGGKKSRHHHHHHHHHQHHSHHKSGGERRTNCTEGGGANAKDVYEGATSAHSRRFSLREGDLAPSRRDDDPNSLDLRRGSADAATGSAKHPTPLLHPHKGHSKPKPKSKPKPASDYSYPFLHYSSSSSSKPRSRSRTRHKPHHPHLERSSSFHSRHSLSDDIYDSRRQNSEVYSIPAALPDPSPAGAGGAGAEARGLKGSVSVPGKLSATARQVRESSEVYGTRAGLERCHNRLLSDLIMLNYNRQVLNM